MPGGGFDGGAFALAHGVEVAVRAVLFAFRLEVENLSGALVVVSLIEMGRTHLYDVSNKIRQNFVLLDLFTIVSNLLFHNVLFML